MTYMELTDLGFDQWFGTQADALSRPGCAFARVCAVDRGSYLIRGEAGDAQAELAGRLSYSIDSPSELPCVGDWVTASFYNDDSAAIIHEVFPRRTFLRRKTPGESVDYQMIATNIDTAFLVQSCHFDFNPARLERYLVMAADGGVEPVVLLTKTDLADQAELDEKFAAIAAVTRARVIALSSVTGSGLDELRQSLAPGGTYCLLGSSGVGKTSLINRLVGREAFETSAVSGTGEGTHTTTRRHLVSLEGGAMLIDTPGMRELGILGAGEGVAMSFGEFAELAGECRYADCTHRHEPGCAVRAAVERGDLDADRYATFLKLRKESEFHEMSYLDKRRKDRDFGKMVKSVKKYKMD
jgi:ribosome biogenesis GTPase